MKAYLWAALCSLAGRIASLRTGVSAHEGGAIVGDAEYRFGHLVVGTGFGSAAGRWWWGQFSPMIPHADLCRLFGEAPAEGALPPDS